MRITKALLGLLLFAAPTAYGQAIPPRNGPYTGVVGTAPYMAMPLKYCQLSVGSTVVTLTGCPIPTNARVAYIEPAGTIRYRDDGSPPTSTVGYTVLANSQLVYSGNFSALQMISVSGTVEVDVGFYQ